MNRGTREQGAETRILRDGHAFLVGCSVKDDTVAGGAEPQLVDVQGLMSGGLQHAAQRPGNGLIEQKRHVASPSGPRG